jgi:hypothetical protein
VRQVLHVMPVAVRRKKPPQFSREVVGVVCRRLSSSCHQHQQQLHLPPHPPPTVMSAFRIARSALKVRPSAFRAPSSLLRRGYADVASDKIQLSLVLPHQVRPETDFQHLLQARWLSGHPIGPDKKLTVLATGHIQEHRCVRSSPPS